MDIYSELTRDHRDIKGLLEELIALRYADDYREIVIAHIEQSLIPHTKAEEMVFYNSLRALSPENSHVIDSFKEHYELENLIKILKIKESNIFEWKEIAIKLKNEFVHHVAGEEGKVFAEARKVFSDEEAHMIGAAFVEMKSKMSDEDVPQTSLDMIVNMMPPRLVEKIKYLK